MTRKSGKERVRLPLYQMHPDVVWVERPDGSSCLLHMSANACRLDAHSTQLLKSILEFGLERSILDLAEHFDVDEQDVRDDVSIFIADLLKQRVIYPRAQQASPIERLRADAACTAITVALGLVHRSVRGLRCRTWWLLLVARWAVAQVGWAKTMKAWEQRYPQPTHESQSADATLIDEIDQVVCETAARSFLNHQCKERALTCLALARENGIAAHLVIGLTYMPLRAHVWVECGNRIISDNPEHCRFYDRVTYDGKGGILPLR
jgi:hypothetical protein